MKPRYLVLTACLLGLACQKTPAPSTIYPDNSQGKFLWACYWLDDTKRETMVCLDWLAFDKYVHAEAPETGELAQPRGEHEFDL